MFSRNVRKTTEHRYWSLRLLLLLPFLLQTIGVVSVVYYLVHRNGQQAVQKLVTQIQTTAADRVEQRLNFFFSQPTAVVQTNAAAVMLKQLDLQNHAAVRPYFLQQRQVFSYIDGLYWGTETGQFFCVCGTPTGEPVEKIVEQSPQRQIYSINETGDRLGLRSEETYDPRERPWYRPWHRSWYRTSGLGGQSHPTLYWSDIYSFTDGSLGITASSPIYDQVPTAEDIEERSLIGVAGADIRLSQISDFLQEISAAVNPEGQIFIVERSGRFVAASAPSSEDSDVPIATQALEAEFDALSRIDEPQQFSYRREDRSRQFIGAFPYQDTAGLDWLIVVEMPASEFMGEIQRSTQMTMRWCALALFISILLSMAIAHILATPIQRFSQAATAISNGDFDQTVSGGRIREVQLLAQAFNRMTRSLRQSFADLEAANASLEDRVQKRTADLKQEKEKSERLLLNILPQKIADQLKQQQQPIARSFDEVSILFADIVGFTPLSSQNSAAYVVNLLNHLFCEFDDLVELHQLEKIKTIGDAYMVAAGLPEERKDHADVIAVMALDMMTVFRKFVRQNQLNLSIRIGVNSGAAVGGVIGHKKFIYDLWGDAVNIAARMESGGEPNRIQVSEMTYQQIHSLDYQLEKRGKIRVKGKGEMTTYWLNGEVSQHRVRQKQLAAEPVVRLLKSPEDVALARGLSA